jgi:tRNA nucleotidyltransferase (CCA-adding enzyme)
MADYRFSNEERARVVHLVREHVFRYEPEWSDAGVRRFLRRVGPQNLEDLFAVHEADVGGKGMPSDSLEVLSALRARIEKIGAKEAALTTKALAVDGRDVMEVLQIPPSRRVGEVLESLLEVVLESPEENDRERLLARMRGMR